MSLFRLTPFFILIIFVLCLSGCVETFLITKAVTYQVETKQERDEFNINFDEINKLRIVAGHPPLDYCIEKYKFDKSWIMNDHTCYRKVKEYKKEYSSIENEQMLDAKYTPILFPGAPRIEVVKRLGVPAGSKQDTHGNYIDSYLLVERNKTQSNLTIYYNSEDKIKEFKRITISDEKELDE